MSTTMTSEEQRVVKQQILAAFEHGCSVPDLLSTTAVPLHRATVYRLHQRFQTDPETALSDGRHGHPSKIRGDVRAWLEAYCQATVRSQLDRPFPNLSEPACCKYLGCMIKYAQYYLLGVFDQWTPER